MYYTLKQSAEFLGLGITSTKRLIEDKQIPAIVTPSKKNSLRVTYKIDDSALRQFKRAKATTQSVTTNGHSTEHISAVMAPAPTSTGLRRVSDVKRELGIMSESFIYDRIRVGRVEVTREQGVMLLAPDAVEIIRQDWLDRKARAKHGVRYQALAVTSNDVQALTPTLVGNRFVEKLNARDAKIEQLEARVDALQRALLNTQGRLEQVIDALGGFAE